MKGILVVLMTLALWWAVNAHAVTPDELLQGDRIAQGRCMSVNSKMNYCMVVKYEEKDYLVLLDDEFDPTAVYDVTGKQMPYDLRNTQPIWTDKGTV